MGERKVLNKYYSPIFNPEAFEGLNKHDAPHKQMLLVTIVWAFKGFDPTSNVTDTLWSLPSKLYFDPSNSLTFLK